MIYEFIATITAGFGMAGIALIIRHISKLLGKTTPKWLIPVFAGIGMLGFQIYQEYYWYDQQSANLPEQVEVIKTFEESTWLRPWSYVKPQIVRFAAIDKNSIEINQQNTNLRKVNVYLFERRISTKIVPQVVDCSQAIDINANKDAQKAAQASLLQAVCTSNSEQNTAK